jgi:hypothetical protein
MNTRLVLATVAAALMAACGTSASDRLGAPASAIVGRAGAAGRDVTILSGTILQMTLSTAVASDTSQVEDAVAGELTKAVMVGGGTALPSGALVAGVVRAVDPSRRVRGRARVALDFTSVTSGGRRYAISAEPFSRLASADTRGEEVRFPSGTEVSIRLAAPLTVHVSN